MFGLAVIRSESDGRELRTKRLTTTNAAAFEQAPFSFAAAAGFHLPRLLMPAKKKATEKPLTGAALIKETCRRIRVARSYWDAHNNRGCRATDIDPVAVRWVQKLIAADPSVAGRIECRLQHSETECFRAVMKPAEYFDATMCTPPFHASAAETAAGTRRKARNLGTKKAVLNFEGTSGELWCDGGEPAFLRGMVAESLEFAHRCRWFTKLVSKSENLPSLRKALKMAHAADAKIIEMAQGQKKSRILAWTFQP